MLSKPIKKQIKELLEHYGQRKESDFDFDRIKLFLENKKPKGFLQIISDRTWCDLDMDEVFMFIDRTCSKIGQQYLYFVLRTIPKTNQRVSHLEKIIDFIGTKQKVKDKCVVELHRLDDHGAYFIQNLIYGKHLTKPSWYWCFPILSGVAFGTLISMFFFPVYLLFILILAVNFVIHYWNKSNLLTYSNSIPQLLKLVKISRKLNRQRELFEDHNNFKESLETVAKITERSNFLAFENKMSSDLGQVGAYFMELIKATFLIEPIIIFNLIAELEKKKSRLENLLISIAAIDVAFSIHSLREGLQFHCHLTQGDSLKAIDVYHPLIKGPVANTIDLTQGKSVLISGSNMSGKTTFIRTIGINTILAQTINTVCARNFTIPKLKVHTAIRIADDLSSETSYYYEEVKVIKDMIDECDSESQKLFLLDELFKGTNTIERVASGKAVLSYLNQKENIVFASTHDLELIDYLADSFRFCHFEEIVDQGELSFDFKLKSGKWNNTNAIRILEVEGYPKKITNEARELAQNFRKMKESK